MSWAFLTLYSTEFRSQPLIYISSPKPSKWVSLQSCRWQSPASIVTLYALHERYRQNAELFRHKLHLGDATAQDVSGELIKLSGRTESIKEIRALLKLLTSFVQAGKIELNSLPLMHNHLKLLPVQLGDGAWELRPFSGNDWFVEEEDMPWLMEAFRGKVYFVDPELSSKEANSARPVLQKLGMLARLLDLQVDSHLLFPNEGYALDEETQVLRGKAEYLARYVTRSPCGNSFD